MSGAGARVKRQTGKVFPSFYLHSAQIDGNWLDVFCYNTILWITVGGFTNEWDNPKEYRVPTGRNDSMPSISLELQEQLNTLLLPVLILAVLAFAVCADAYVKKSFRRIMLTIAVIILTLIADDCVTNVMLKVWVPSFVPAMTGLSVYSYVMRPVCIVLFIYIVCDSPKRRLFWIPVVLNAAVYLTAFWRPWVFRIDRDGLFFRGPLGYTAHIVCTVLLAAQMIVAIVHFGQVRQAERLIPFTNSCVAVLGMVMDSMTPSSGTISFAEIAAVFCSVFYYVWIHLRFVHEHEQAMEEEQRIRIMFSQIRPHFLYNTLTTIQALCLENPKKAAAITERFAAYLRRNIDTLNQKDLIPFRKEMDHTLAYVQIEMARFPNIHLDYEVEDEDFSIPALTVQPVVENAIRHGVRGMKKGQIDIITNLLPDCHEIVIRDNGKGFSVDKLPSGSEESHIGIQNVRERLEKLCGGTMTIDSGEGKGTCVTIHIPRGKESS